MWRYYRSGRKLTALTVAVCFMTTQFQGCASMESSGTGSKVLMCAGVGALIGGVLGAIEGGRHDAAKGAGIGAVAGALGCWIYYKNKELKGYEQTKQETGYQASQGDTVQVTDYKLDPAVVQTGTEVKLSATYVVMASEGGKDIQVTETRIFKKLDPKTHAYDELGRAVDKVTVKPGTRKSDGAFRITEDITPGDYIIAFEIKNGDKSDVKEQKITVT